MSTIKTYTISLILIIGLSLTPTKNSYAVCDGCVAGAVTKASITINANLAAIIALLEKIDINLSEIGKALQQQIEASTTGFAALNQTMIQIAKIEVNEAHLLTEKVETLKIKQNINDKFGVVSNNLCFEINETSGKAGGNKAIENAVKDTVNLYISEYRKNLRGVGSRTRVISEIPDTVNVQNFFNGTAVADEEMLAVLPQSILALTESKEYEAPKDPLLHGKLNNTDEDYRQKYRSRQFSMQITQDILRKSATDQSIPSVEIGNWVKEKLLAANLDPSQYVDGALSTKAGVIEAIAHDHFGATNSAELSGLFGPELLKRQAGMLAHNNYLLAQNWKLANDQKILAALDLAKKTEDHYNEELTDALNNALE